MIGKNWKTAKSGLSGGIYKSETFLISNKSEKNSSKNYTRYFKWK